MELLKSLTLLDASSPVLQRITTFCTNEVFPAGEPHHATPHAPFLRALEAVPPAPLASPCAGFVLAPAKCKKQGSESLPLLSTRGQQVVINMHHAVRALH